MKIDCKTISPDSLYFVLTQTVIPRPIAWVLSDNGDGSHNLAPFSFFNAVAANPPILMISVGWKDDQTRKDTWVNIDARDHFVVHIPSFANATTMVATSATLSHGDSEIKKFGVELVEEKDWSLPRIKEANVAFLCQRYAIYEIGNDPQGMILGEVKSIWIDDTIAKNIDGRIKVDAEILAPIARLGGNNYSVLQKPFLIKRPH